MSATVLLISALAVVITLIYASWLDIRERRVPFRTWYPMLIVGISATTWYFYSLNNNLSFTVGYLALVAALLFTAYLDRRERRDPWIYPFLALVLVLPLLSWFVLPGTLSFSVLPWYVMYGGIISYAAYLDIRGQEHAVRKWYPLLMVIVFAFASTYFSGLWGEPAKYIALVAVFCGIFYLFATMHFFGGADAWALIFISLTIPAFPVLPLFGESPLGFLPFSVLINAVILNLIAPIGIFVMNIVKGNRGPVAGLFFGFPVEGSKIKESWGFVMEDISEKNGVLERKFVSFTDAMRRMVADENRIYTKDLREHPEKYKKELALYGKAGKVWISYAVPFILPITAGLVVALVFGDILFTLMRVIIGG